MMHRQLTRIELTMSDIEEWNKAMDKKIKTENENKLSVDSNKTNTSTISNVDETERRRAIRLRIGYETPKER